MENEEKFSDNEEEHLRIENELLRLKLMAQFGNDFQMHSEHEIPPEVENKFLKNVIAVEDQFASGDHTAISIFEKIGKPPFTLLENISSKQLETELKRLKKLLQQNNIAIHFEYGPYSNEAVYKYITERVFQKEVEKDIFHGMIWNFIYEEDFPNNEEAIKKNTHLFFEDWLFMKFNEYSGQMASEFLSANGSNLTRNEVYEKIKLFSDCFVAFNNDGYNIDNIKVDGQPDGSFMGFSEGMYKYDAQLENGEYMHFEGPFKLYQRREIDETYWRIFHFVIPGFNQL